MPIQRPIPAWFAAQSEPAYRWVGRMADGWFPQMGPGAELEAARSVIDEAARDAGRDPALGVEGRVHQKGSTSQAADEVAA